MFMCYKHHHETHDIDIYPVSKLKQIKQEHEEKYKYNPYQFDFSLIYKANNFYMTQLCNNLIFFIYNRLVASGKSTSIPRIRQ